ncbi:MAG: DUF4339 domain-containing protein [Bacteriovoracia bacterium]
MNAKEPTWFVRIQGHTLGPLTTDELKASVREGEIGPSDKLTISGANEWQTLEDHDDLLAYWKSFHKPALSFSLPSPKILWKKKAAPPEPPPVMEPAPKIEAKKAEQEAPPPAKAVSAPKPKAAKPKKSKPTKKTKAPLKAKKKPVPQPAKEEIREAEPVEVPEKIVDAVFPDRPPVPDLVVHIPEVPRFSAQPESRKKKFRIAAIAAAVFVVILGVAGISYWAGKKTRDLKEFPLPDPSSPTSQPSTAGDPVLPLRAPTRPQRD